MPNAAREKWRMWSTLLRCSSVDREGEGEEANGGVS